MKNESRPSVKKTPKKSPPMSPKSRPANDFNSVPVLGDLVQQSKKTGRS